MIFHESVHLLVNNKVRSLPSWFNEGLAEYYSTLYFLPEKQPGDKRVAFGKPLLHHLIKLRENKLLPLETVFSVDQSSPFYNEADKRSMFYAESWALIHYLTHGRSGERQPQLARFLGLLAARLPVADSFKQAFGTDYASLERELKDYVRQDRYPAKVVSFEEPAGTNTDSKIEQLSEAQALTYLGDLLMHTNRFADAEKHLQKALTLAPELSMANASLGVLRLRQGDVAAAKGLLQKAIAGDQNNYLAQYYYADALSREEMDSESNVSSYPAESVARMRKALNKAIEVAPGFPEPYRLLAFVNLVTNTQITESVGLVEKAIALSPSRLDFSFVLAQVQLRRKDYKAAQLTLQQVIAGNPTPQMRVQAEVMLDRAVLEEQSHSKQ
jgi:tetratricopeptide (TPR) repeat protein